MPNPLDPFATQKIGGNPLRLTPMPKLAQLVQELGFKQGLEGFDEAMEGWRVQTERSLNERLNLPTSSA